MLKNHLLFLSFSALFMAACPFAATTKDSGESDADVDADADGDADGDADADADSDADADPGAYTGTFEFQYGWDLNPNVYLLDCWWNTVGQEAAIPCPDCLWAFDVTFNFDQQRSVGAEKLKTTDIGPWGLGLIEDYQGYGPMVAMLSDTNEWYPGFYAEWNQPNVRFWYGLANYPYKGYYYTNYMEGKAEIGR